MKRLVCKLIFFRLSGWKITGAFDPNIRQCVIMVMPHTGWQDFFVGLFARGIIGLEMNWVGKKELFRFPMAGFFRWMGGAPLDRSGGLNKVDSIAAIFTKLPVFRMAIAPEGTRKKVSEIKTGFYYIALKACVPIIPVAFDFENKTVRLGNYFYPTGNVAADLRILLDNFNGIKGKNPEKGFDVENFLKSAKP